VGLTLSIASFKFFWKIAFSSQNPCFVFPKELGPTEVGVSLPIFLILILASAGISSGSSSLPSPKTEATWGGFFITVLLWAGGAFKDILIGGALGTALLKPIDIFVILGAGGGGEDA